MSDPVGFQWLVDPSGRRWKVVGLSPVVAHLEAEDGQEVGLGRAALRKGLELGAWQWAEFEEVSRA